MATIWSPEIKDNPLNFVLYAFPWGKRGTPLEHFPGPRTWQKEELQNIATHIQENKNRVRQGKDPTVYQFAMASGRGPGKSAFVAWLTLWFLSTQVGGSVISSANTEAQLKTKTWAEIGKWAVMAINSHWFEKQTMSLKPADWFKEALEKQLKIDTGYYSAQGLLWSQDSPDSFAGAHNQQGMMLIFDEASGIPAVIWSVSDGFFTEKTINRYWFAFSNPRRNTGAFFECFHKHRNYWRTRNLDARTVEGMDTKVLDDIVTKYGSDSDEARVEVKGEFPRQGDRQFISRGIVDDAVARELEEDPNAPLLMGVDPARFGNDSTVIRWRQGRNGKVIPPTKMRGADNMEVANECAMQINKYNPDAVFIDAGNGTGIIDRLREKGFKVHEVWFGSRSSSDEWANKRTEIWAEMRDWLGGACIDNDPELISDLTAPEYKFQGNSDRQMLESKEQLKSRGFASPDNADALACTFAIRVARRDGRTSKKNRDGPRHMAKDIDYPLFGN